MASVRETITNNLHTALKNIIDDTDNYELPPKTVDIFDWNHLEQPTYLMPAIFLNDSGEEDPVVKGSDAMRFRWNFQLVGVIQDDSPEEIIKNVNRIKATINEFIASQPSLGSDVLAFKYVNTQAIDTDATTGIGTVAIQATITYCDNNGAY